MCGVVGYIGKKTVDKELVNVLKSLEYRGYDSAGVAYIKDGEISVIKSAGKISNLENILLEDKNCVCGIAHTRWATHGKPTDTNAHPHLSNNKSWAIVHNGIIENYSELKKDIMKNTSIKFASETDTEVVSQLLEIYDCEDKITTLINVCKMLEGSYALACLNKDNDGVLYLAKNKSPLYVAVNNFEVYVASDPICFAGKCDEYYSLEDNEFAKLSVNNVQFYNNKHISIDKKSIKLTNHEMNLGKKNYPHYMLKEIYEVPTVLNRIVGVYRDNCVLDKFTLDFVKSFRKIVIIGCGTAYHAGLMGERFLEKFAGLECRTFVASEFRYANHIIDKNTLCIFVSQSGETADTLACAEIAKASGATCVGLTNVLYSSLAKMVDIILPVCAGPEIAVASTKAYSAQIAIFYMLAKHIEKLRNGSSVDILFEIEVLSGKYPNPMEYDLDDLVDELVSVKDAFFIGRDLDYITATEGSLKLKEITYINSSAYPSGELKHGFLALVENGTHLFVLATQKDLLDKTLNGASEGHARGGKIILITQLDLPEEKLSQVYKLIKLPKFTEDLMPIVAVGVFQILSYLVSVKKGINPDQPRNLAKSVTVE